MFAFDKDTIKNSLTLEQIFDLVQELGGEPVIKDDTLICKTICHGGDSHKLYIYGNTRLCKCFTGCEDSNAFDIFELVQKVMNRITNQEWTLPKAVSFVASYFGFKSKEKDFDDFTDKLEDWTLLKDYDKLKDIKENQQIVELKIYDDNILKHFSHPRILDWEDEGITREVMMKCGIAYDPVNEGIIIPHYDMDNRLVGIRERTLVREMEKFGKYLPARINGKMYNHSLGFNLYNLNNSKNNIKLAKKVIVFESEKSTMKYASFFSIDNDISVAVCGSALTAYQFKLLLSLGIEELIIAFDKQFQEIGDDEFKRWTKKLKEINKKYSPYVRVSFMFDKWELLGYKDAPIDKGKEIFLELFEKRIIL